MPHTAPATTATRRRDSPGEVAARLIQDYDAVVFDCDGVLWKGDELVTPLIPTLLQQLRRHGKPYLFFTNNSLRARADYAAKFARLGLKDVGADRIFASSYAAAAFLARRERQAAASSPSTCPPPIQRAYVVGGQGIIDELRLAGFEAFGGPDDSGKTVDFSLGEAAEISVPGVGAVVVGVDPQLNYWKIHYAAQCLLQNPDCLFLACNEDSRGHFTPNQEWPGAGASVAAVSAVVGRRPDVVVGKPSTFMAREVVACLVEEAAAASGGGSSSSSSRPPRVLMVGDRLDTDVAWAHAAADELAAEGQPEQQQRQFGALLVMSGVVTDADLAAWEGRRPPEFVLADVGELAEALAAVE